MKLKFGDRLEVIWTDCFGTASWSDTDTLPEPPNIHSVGYFIAERNKGLYLASGLDKCADTHNGMLAPFWIPKAVIRKLRRLK